MHRRTHILFCLALVLGATLTLTVISAQQARRTGEITAIDAVNHSFVVKTARGETQIRTTEETVYLRGEEKLNFEDLKVGDSLQVTGTREPDHVVAIEVTVQTN
jgi:ABC-type enterochelin transport system substrate-binding protein